jgi:hypothetical protein
VRFARNCGLIRGEWIAIDGSKFRAVARHLYEDALNRMQERLTPAMMKLCRSTVEHPSRPYSTESSGIHAC